MTPGAGADLLGWLGFAALLALWIVLYVRWKRGRARRAWAPLMPLVNGRASGHWLHGSYEGRPVRARLAGLANDAPTHPNKYPRFSMSLGTARDARNAARASTWRAEYAHESVGDIVRGAPKTWHVETDDAALREELTRTGLLTRLEQWGTDPVLSYDPRRGQLNLQEDLREGPVPDPKRFHDRLELLARLATITEHMGAARA